MYKYKISELNQKVFYDRHETNYHQFMYEWYDFLLTSQEVESRLN